MAIIKCPECGNDVSDKAESCPHCGYKLELQKCPECGSMIGKDEKVCPHCGFQFGMKKCPECGNMVSEDAKICPHCGIKLESEPEAAPKAEPSPTPQQAQASSPQPAKFSMPQIKNMNKKNIIIVAVTIAVVVILVIFYQKSGFFGTSSPQATAQATIEATAEIDVTEEPTATEDTTDDGGDSEYETATYKDTTNGVTFDYYKSFSVETLSDGLTYIGSHITTEGAYIPYCAVYKQQGYSDEETFLNDLTTHLNERYGTPFVSSNISEVEQGGKTYKWIRYTYTSSNTTVYDYRYAYSSGDSTYVVFFKSTEEKDSTMFVLISEILSTLKEGA